MQCITEMKQNAWTSSIHGKFYRKIESKVSSKIKYSHSSSAKEVTVFRLRFGKCRLNDYHVLGLRPDDMDVTFWSIILINIFV